MNNTFDYTFCPETSRYFDSSLKDEVLEVSYEIIVGQVHINKCVIWTSGTNCFDLLPILLAFNGTHEIEEAAKRDWEFRQQERIYKAYPDWNKQYTLEGKLEMLKLK